MILYMIIGVFLLTFFKAPFIFYFLYPIPLAIILIKSRVKSQKYKESIKDNRVFTKEYRTYKSKEDYLNSKLSNDEYSSKIKEALNYFNLTKIDKAEIKKIYKKLSKIYHPDKGGNIEKMAELNKYYSILK